MRSGWKFVTVFSLCKIFFCWTYDCFKGKFDEKSLISVCQK